MALSSAFQIFTPGWRILRDCPPRLVWKFAYTFGLKSALNFRKFEKRLAKGEPFFPAFLMISLTNRCNLACRGCWVTQTRPARSLTAKQFDGIITTAKKRGSCFFGLLGGEPLLYEPLFEVIAKHPDCYFQLFTNGTTLTAEIAQKMRKLANISPLVSIEGLETESRLRRGKEDVFARSVRGLSHCTDNKLITGVAASIGKSNFDELVSEKYIQFLAEKGVHYLWYYIYRPAGPDPNPANALSEEQIVTLRRFIVEQRTKAPLLIIETYWDAKGNALCPGAMGVSHHISPEGAVEFCPPIQFAAETLNEEGSNLEEIFAQSTFLADLRNLTASTTRGCILLEQPDALLRFVEQHNTPDSSARGTAHKELAAMQCLSGHHIPGKEIPESNPFYRFAKKYYFFGFGAYG